MWFRRYCVPEEGDKHHEFTVPVVPSNHLSVSNPSTREFHNHSGIPLINLTVHRMVRFETQRDVQSYWWKRIDIFHQVKPQDLSDIIGIYRFSHIYRAGPATIRVFKADVEDLTDYKILFIPPLYSASDDEIIRLNEFVRNGGTIVYMFKSGFTNENVQVRKTRMPALLRETLGVSYQQFTNFPSIPLKTDVFELDHATDFGQYWGELLTDETAEVLASYDHIHWGKYAAITRNKFGAGTAYYCGTYPSLSLLKKIIISAFKEAGLSNSNQEYSFPLIVRNGKNRNEEDVHYFLNYSAEPIEFEYFFNDGRQLLTNLDVDQGMKMKIAAWDFTIIVEK